MNGRTTGIQAAVVLPIEVIPLCVAGDTRDAPSRARASLACGVCSALGEFASEHHQPVQFEPPHGVPSSLVSPTAPLSFDLLNERRVSFPEEFSFFAPRLPGASVVEDHH